MSGGIEKPAFPQEGRRDKYGDSWWEGMTLRDYFAGQALQYIGKRKDIQLRDAAHIASLSYEIADAMLTARTDAGRGGGK